MSAEVFREQLEVPGDRVISALDNMTWEQAEAQLQEVGPHIGMGKVNSLYQRLGADHAIDTLADNGVFTMLDGKFHDIPETVQAHVREVTQAGASLITVHASGGLKMLKAAVAGAEEGRDLTRNVFKQAAAERVGAVLGITVLTSLGDEVVSIFGKDAQEKVVDFAHSALEAGLDGIVCSVKELPVLAANSNFDRLLKVVPGITPTYAKKAEDQARTGTPAAAIEEGADLIVIGRGINKAKDYDMTKADAAKRVAEEVQEGLDKRVA